MKDLMIQGRIVRINSLNYQWIHERVPGEPYISPGNDLVNWNFNLSLIYHLPTKDR